MFWNMFRIEQTKLFKRKLLWVELALIVILVGASLIGIFIVMQTTNVPPEVLGELRDVLLWPQSLTSMMGLVAGNQFGGLVMIVLVGAVVAQEYTWKTMSLWLSNGVPRPVLLIAKFTAILVAALLVVLSAFMVSALLTLFSTIKINGALDLSQVDVLKVIQSIVHTICSMLPYISLTFLLAIRSRSSVVAIGGSVAFALVGENIIVQLLNLLGGVAAKIALFFPKSLAQSLTSGGITVTVSTGMPAPSMLDPGVAFIGIAVQSIILFGLALWVFQRQDLTK
jgi:ABC-type transport system involved in multi-copper enzyme maturation permease subunit